MFNLRLALVVVVLFAVFSSSPILASVVVQGDVDPIDPTTWGAGVDVFVGKNANGRASVSDSSEVSTGFLYLGYDANTVGEVAIAGVDSVWNYSGKIFVGNDGHGILKISDGGSLLRTAMGGGYIGYNVGSSGQVVVEGAGSKWEDHYPVSVGYQGTGTLSIKDGGKVSAACDIGDQPGSVGVVNVDGAGSTCEGITVTVGVYGVGTLNVTNGGTVVGMGTIGLASGSIGQANVTGVNSSWENNDLSVGQYGSGVLNITEGGTVDSNTSCDIAHMPGSQGMVNVRGAGSTWNVDLGVFVGSEGTGTLNVAEGGAVQVSKNVSIGAWNGSVGVVHVDGAGSTLACERLEVGKFGQGTLNIANGGAVNVTHYTLAGDIVNPSGLIHFGTNGGTLNTGSLFASTSELTGTGTINTKGLVSDVDIVLDATHGLEQTLVLDGPGKNISINLDLNSTESGSETRALGVGYRGNGSMMIRDGLEVSSYWGYLGAHTGSSGVATVLGDGTVWRSHILWVGDNGRGILNIFNGGMVQVDHLLDIDQENNGDSFINMGSGGMLAVEGSIPDWDKIRWWDDSIGAWASLDTATYGEDYTQVYMLEGDLAGYTLLTVSAAVGVPEPSTVVLLLMLAVGLVPTLRKRMK